MLTSLKPLTALITAVCVLTLNPLCVLSVVAAETPSEETTPTTSSENSDPPQTFDNLYDQAKAELPENLYVLYRIIERTARANNLDHHPWRVIVIDDSEIDAYATEANLIVVSFGLLEQLMGDSSALACVVSHEMAHHVQEHIAIRTSQVAEWQEQYHEEDDSEKVEELITELSQTQELEADAIGYRYAATAGFDGLGCLRGLDVLSRLPNSRVGSSSHPAVPDRVKAMSQLLREQPSTQLAQQGQRLLSGSSPLTYEMLDGDRWLRINSERGGSFVEDLDRLFPNP